MAFLLARFALWRSVPLIAVGVLIAERHEIAGSGCPGTHQASRSRLLRRYTSINISRSTPLSAISHSGHFFMLTSELSTTMTLDSIHETISRIGLRTKAENIPMITSKGKQFSWLFDLRRVFMQREALEQISLVFWERNKAHEPFQLAGLETAGIPLLTALMLTAPKERVQINGFIIRKDRKTTGIGNAIEGIVNDLPVRFD